MRWILLGLAVLVAISFFVARSRRKPGPPIVLPVEKPSVPVPAGQDVRVPPSVALPRPSDNPRGTGGPAVAVSSVKGTDTSRPSPKEASNGKQRSPFAEKVDGWIASRTWSKGELELLVILRDAERQGSVQGARGAIKSLMYRPPVEDLKDQLIRRLGDLNTQLLFSGTSTPWTATVVVKRGDTLQRIASDHRTTLEALQKLNPLKDPNRLALGQTLRVLNFPDADLVIHKQLQFAELLLKKNVFKRYYLSVRATAEPGAYPVTTEAGSRATDRLRALIQHIAPADRDELRLFLAPGSRITVTAQ